MGLSVGLSDGVQVGTLVGLTLGFLLGFLDSSGVSGSCLSVGSDVGRPEGCEEG